jgi:hypothetical protein
MAGNSTQNQSPLIKAEVFSEFLLEQIIQGTLPDGLYRNVSDFGDGETLFIPVMGETTLRDYAEDTQVQYDAVDTGQISLTITDYVSAGSYVTRKLQQDAYKAAALEAQIPKDHFRLIRERFETQMLATSNKQTLANPNTINNFSHRWVANSTATLGVLSLEDILYMKLAFDKAYIPENGRIFVVDPIVEASLNHNAAAQAFNYNPQFQGIVLTGFEGAMRFVRNIFGFDIWVSNRLPAITSETITGGPQAASTAITGGVANVAMCVTDDQFKPFMGAWRQMPKTDGEFNKDFQRDEYVTTARWGFGLQRPESLGVVISSATLYK